MRVDLRHLTPAEEKSLVQELSEKIKDSVYAKSEDLANEVLDSIRQGDGHVVAYEETICITHTLRMSAGILIDIVARIRRAEDDNG